MTETTPTVDSAQGGPAGAGRRKTKNSVNVPLLIGTLVVGAILAPAAYAWHSYQVHRIASSFLDRADRLEQEQKWQDAARYLHSYAQLRADDATIRGRLAQTFDKSASDPSRKLRAIDLYYQALGTVPADQAAPLRRRLTELLLEMQRFAPAEKEAMQLLAAEKEDPEAKRLLALALDGQLRSGALVGTKRNAVVIVQALEDALRAEANRGHIRLSAALARVYRNASELPDDGLAGILARIYTATDKPVPAELSGIAVRIVRAERAPLPESLAKMQAELDAKATEASGSQFATLLTSMYHAKKPPARERQQAVARAVRGVLADDVMDQMAAANPKNPESFLTRYHYRVRNALPDAEGDLKTALELGPDNALVLLTAAERARQDAQSGGLADTARAAYDEAHGYYKRALEINPSLEAAYVGLGQVLVAQGHADQAVTVWTEGLTHCGKTSIPLNSALAELRTVQGKIDEAGKHLKVLEEQTRQLTPYLSRSSLLSLECSRDLLRGKWQLRKGDYSAAIALLKQVTAGGAGAEHGDAIACDAYASLAMAYGALAQPDLVAASYEKVAELRPKTVEAQLAAAATWLTAGRPDPAIRYYERALALADNSEGWLGVARAHLMRQALLPKAQRNWDGFDNALREIKKPEHMERLGEGWRVPVLEVQSLTMRSGAGSTPRETATGTDQTTRQHKEMLDEAQKVYANSTGLFRSLTLLYDGLGYAEEANHALETFERLDSKSVDASLLRSALCRRRGQLDEARTVLEQAIGSLPAESVLPLRTELVEVSLSEGNLGQARRELDSLIAAQPQVPGLVRLLCQLADLAVQAGDLGELEKCESQLRASEGESGSYWRYYRARRLLSHTENPANVNESDDLQRQIESQRPTWPAASFLAGMILEQRGKNKEAAERYQQAIRLGDRSIFVYERLIRLAYAAQRFEEADQYLSQLQQEGLSSSDLASMESRIAAGRALASPGVPTEAKHEQLRRALDSARRSVEQRPEDPLRQIWLGNLLLLSCEGSNGEEASQQQREAETAFREAVRLAPADARTYHSLFGCYLRTEQRGLAEETVKEVERTVSLQPHERAFVMGRMYEQLGKRDEAEKNYRQAAKIAQEHATGTNSDKMVAYRVAVLRRLAAFLLHSDPEKAIAEYREICRLLPASDSDRRILASVLALRSAGKYDEKADQLWQEADNLLTNAGAASNSAMDLRLRAALLHQRGGAENLKKAQELLERLLANPDDSSDFDRLALARIHAAWAALRRAEGDESKAKQEQQEASRQYASLVARDKPDGAHLLAYIDFLLRNGLTAEAAPWQKKIQPLAAADAQLLGSYADLLVRHGQEADASPVLAQLEALAPDDFRTTELRAQWLNLRGETAKIEPLVESAAARLLETADKEEQKGAQLCLRVGTLYSAVKRYDLAAQWYRRVVELLPEEYESLAVSLARQGRTKEAVQICNEAAGRGNLARAAVAITSVLAYGQPTPEDFQLAGPTLSQAAQQYKDDAAVLLAVANARFIEKRADDAVQLYRDVLKLQPRNVLVLNNLATLLLEQPEGRDEALRYVNQAIDIAGPQPMLLDTKGTALLYNDKPQEAVHCLEEAVRSPNPDPRFYLHLAAAYHRIGRADKARSALKDAQESALDGEILTPGDRTFLAELKQSLDR